MRNKIIAALLTLGTGCAGTPGTHLGVSAEGHLARCPDTPNCVSSQAGDTVHAIPPLKYRGTLPAAYEKILAIVASTERTEIKLKKDTYLHVTYTSALFRFVDDVEFYFNDREKIIEVRSASRIGSGDLGVNRKRIEQIRVLFNREE